MRGGSRSEFDADMAAKIQQEEDWRNDFVYFQKKPIQLFRHNF